MMNNSTENSLERLGALLDLPDLGGEDWDLLFANPARVAEFCDVYEHGSLNATEKVALMELTVASYDRLLSEANHQHTLEARLARLLEQDFALHKQTVEYWSKLQSHNPESLWAVSPWMRKIWQRHSGEA